MFSLAFLGLASFLLALLLTAPVRNAFRRWGIVDHPGDRHIHHDPIPRVGGVAIALTYVLSYVALLVVKLHAGQIIWGALDTVVRLLPAAILIFTIGLIDDIRGLKPWHKLLGEVIAAVLAWAAGVHVHGFSGFELPAWWSLPLTIIWLILCTNAVNLIDGIDGLAAGVGLFATCTTLLAALLQNNIELALATAPLAGALLGFLRYNFNPATIFLGDSGSLFIGFLLGCYGVLWSQKAATILGMTAPLMALSIPLLDTGLAIVRRFLRRQPIFGADRGHIHHRLLDRGLTPRKAALILYAFCGLGAVGSLVMMTQKLAGAALIVFCLVTWIGIQHLGYVEFGVAGRMFMEGAFRRLLNSQLALRSYEDRLVAAATPDDCFTVIQAASKEFGFERIEMRLAGQRYEWHNEVQPINSWGVNIPISASDYIQLTRTFGSSEQSAVVAPFADALRRALAPKIPVFEMQSVPARVRAAHA